MLSRGESGRKVTGGLVALRVRGDFPGRRLMASLDLNSGLSWNRLRSYFDPQFLVCGVNRVSKGVARCSWGDPKGAGSATKLARAASAKARIFFRVSAEAPLDHDCKTRFAG